MLAIPQLANPFRVFYFRDRRVGNADVTQPFPGTIFGQVYGKRSLGKDSYGEVYDRGETDKRGEEKGLPIEGKVR